jgi:hypothetical protein
MAEGLNPGARGLSLDRIEDIRGVWEGNLKGPLDVGYGMAALRRTGRLGLEFR